MSLRDLGLFYNEAGIQTGQDEIDAYYERNVRNPSVDTQFLGSCVAGTAATANQALTQKQQYVPYPRNLYYSVSGVSGGTFGGTFTANIIDQFGSQVQESVVIAAAANGGNVYGTAIAAQFISGTYQTNASSGTFAGTANVGFGTASNGSSQSNWFGLLTKLGGTADVKLIAWGNNGTQVGLGTGIGTLVGYNNNGSLPNNAFQGTSGVQLTDSYQVLVKSTYDSRGRGTIHAL